jgi:hypothetical protein
VTDEREDRGEVATIDHFVPHTSTALANAGQPVQLWLRERVRHAGHELVWERQHHVLLHASREWLRDGTFDDRTTGSFFVDKDGRAHQV